MDVLGYKPQELLNELCYDFFHPDDLEHMMESYQQGLNSSLALCGWWQAKNPLHVHPQIHVLMRPSGVYSEEGL